MLTAKQIYDRLIADYGQPDWWPGSPYAIMVTAILVQNTVWSNVEKTVAEMGERLTPEYIDNLTEEELHPLIRSCGFYRAKARYVKALRHGSRAMAIRWNRCRRRRCLKCGGICCHFRALAQRLRTPYSPTPFACRLLCWMPIPGASWSGSVIVSRQTMSGGHF